MNIFYYKGGLQGSGS